MATAKGKTMACGVRLDDEHRAMLRTIVAALETPRRSRVSLSDAIRAAIREASEVFQRERMDLGMPV